MRDPALEHQMENMKHLISAWQKFHAYLTGVRQGKEFSQADEAEFLKLKSQIAILHDTMVEVVGTGNRDDTNTVQMVIDVVERCIMLRQMKRLTLAEIKRMEIEWHDGYLLMNDRIGVLQDEIQQLAQVSEFHHKMEVFWGRLRRETVHILTNRYLQVGVFLVALVAAGIVLPALGVYDYSFLDKNTTGRKVHDFGRRFLRESVAGDLEFREWREFVWNLEREDHTIPGSRVTDSGQAASARGRAFQEARSRIGKLAGIERQVADVLAKADETYVYQGEIRSKTGKAFAVTVLIGYFNQPGVASAAFAEFEKWVEEKELTELEAERVRYGRRANVVFFVDSPDTNVIQRAYGRLMGLSEEE